MNTALNLKPNDTKLLEIQSNLLGYWENDIWSTDHTLLSEFNNFVQEKTYRNIDFSTFPSKLKNEVKYFVLSRLKDKEVRLYDTVIENYCKAFKQVSNFLNQYYPLISSFTELDIEKGLMQLRSYLIENDIQLRKTTSNKRYTKYESLLNQLYVFYSNFYDTRTQFEKDIWDVRNIPGARVDSTKAEYFLKFNEIPFKFSSIVKRYIKFRISYLSHGQCRTDIKAIKTFLIFINEKYPCWENLNLLTRKDMEDYIFWYRKYVNGKKAAQTCYLITLRTFLEIIQKHEFEEAPIKSVATLLFKEDIPHYTKSSENTIKYIPEGVLKQIEDNLEHLTPSKYIPIIIILRASGWRISDVLNLKYNSCLEKTEQGWYLCGDIKKTKVLNHRIPITEELSVVIKAVIDSTKQMSNTDNNPQNFLFAEFVGPRKGLPPISSSISRSLNRFARKYNIADDDGNLFHIRNHAFRHTKGIELINNGMNLLHVQKWMAHVNYTKKRDRTHSKL